MATEPLAWEITGKEIVTFWTDIWPKIVALVWWDELQVDSQQREELGLPPDTNYREAFERNKSFRIREAKRIADIIGVHYDSQIPLCVTAPVNVGILIEGRLAFDLPHASKVIDISDHRNWGWYRGWSCPKTLYGDTYFLLNEKGFVLPWPKKPDRDQIFIGYMEGGGVLPRTNPNWINNVPRPAPGPPLPPDSAVGAQLPEREAGFFTEITKWQLPDLKSRTQCTFEGPSGVAWITLIEKWPRVVAQAWKYPPATDNVATEIQNNLEDYIMPEVWSEWPGNVTARFDNAADDIVLSYDNAQDPKILLIVPVPNTPTNTDPTDRRPTEEVIFQELIVGHASNPMYSNCY